MALVTVQRSPCDSDSNNCECQTEDGFDVLDGKDESRTKRKSISECYFAVKGAALVLPHDECLHVYRKPITNGASDIQKHLQSMLYLLHPDDILKMAVKLESIHNGRTRYLVVASRIGKLQTEESCLLGIDCNNQATIGLVLPIWADTRITLDGDGGFSVTSSGWHHIFKPVSVQAMWSALQTLHKASSKAREFNYFKAGGTHQWIDYYEKRITSDRSCLNEWHAMDDLESKRPPSPDTVRSRPTEREETEKHIKAKLKEIMMSVDLDEVTSKYIRTKLEEILDMNLKEFKSFIDQEMLTILGQMDAPTEIFKYLFLGSEWNASNLEELIINEIGYILNVTREIDNFFPGMFDYQNIRVYDDEKTEILHYWDKTYRYIRKAKDEGSKVLVHCKMGISRSASVVIAYVMKAYDCNLQEALNFVKKKRNCIKPNDSFLRQLEIYQGILDASKHRHNSLWRSKSETNLKSSDQPNKDEQLIEKNHGIPMKSESLKHLQIPGTIARPKSWSPNDIVADMLFQTNGSISSEACQDVFGSNIKEKWHDMKDMYIKPQNNQYYDSQCVEPELVRFEPTILLHPESGIPLVSSIKDRINELVSQVSSAPEVKISKTELKSPGSQSRSGLVLNLATQFESGSKPSSPVDEGLVMKPTTALEEMVEPVVSQTKPPVPKHHAVLVKPALWPEDCSTKLCLTRNASKDSNKSNTIAKSPTTQRATGFLPSVSCSSKKETEGSRIQQVGKIFDKTSQTIGQSSAFKPVLSKGDICAESKEKCSADEKLTRTSDPLKSVIEKPKTAEPFSKLQVSGKVSNREPNAKSPRSQKNHEFYPVQVSRPMESNFTRETDQSCQNVPFGGSLIYAKEDIPFTPGTVQRTKQQLEEKSLKRTTSFDSGFELGGAPATPLETESIWGKPVRRSRSLRSEHKPNSMFCRKWYPLPALASPSPKPMITPNDSVPSLNMVHSISTPSIVEAVNQVICGTQEIIISAMQYLPSEKNLNSPSFSNSMDMLEFGSASSLPDIEIETIVAAKCPSTRSESPLPGIVKQQCEILENKVVAKVLFPEKSDSSSKMKNEALKADTGSGSVHCDSDKKIENTKDMGLVKRLTKELEAKSTHESQQRKEKSSPTENDGLRLKTAQERLSPSNCNIPPPLMSDLGLGQRQATGLRSSLPSSVEKRLSCNTTTQFGPPTPHRKTSLDLNFLRKTSCFSLSLKHRLQSKSESATKELYDNIVEDTKPAENMQKPSKSTRSSESRAKSESVSESYNRTAIGRPPPAMKLNPVGCSDVRPPPSLGPLRKIMCKQHGSTHPLSRLTIRQRHMNPLYNTM